MYVDTHTHTHTRMHTQTCTYIMTRTGWYKNFKMVQYFVKYHNINNYHGLLLFTMHIQQLLCRAFMRVKYSLSFLVLLVYPCHLRDVLN